MRRGVAVTFVSVVSAVAAYGLYVLGADVLLAAESLPPLMLVAGYAALAGVLSSSGLADVWASRLGPGPMPVLLLSSAASVFLSNDVVILSLAGVVLARTSRVVDAAALFVGANMTGALLPQGTPKNLLLLGGDVPFSEYLAVSFPVTFVLSVTAGVFFVLLHRGSQGVREVPGVLVQKRHFDAGQRAVMAVAAGAVLAQPLADFFGVSRAAFGTAVLLLAVGAGRYVGVSALKVTSAVPWHVGLVVLVAAAGGPLLASLVFSGPMPPGVATFLISGVATDLAGAALAHPSVADGGVLPAVALAAATAAAYATPFGSVSGILLLQEMRRVGVRPDKKTFAFAASVSVFSFVAAAFLLPVLSAGSSG